MSNGYLKERSGHLPGSGGVRAGASGDFAVYAVDLSAESSWAYRLGKPKTDDASRPRFRCGLDRLASQHQADLFRYTGGSDRGCPGDGLQKVPNAPLQYATPLLTRIAAPLLHTEFA